MNHAQRSWRAVTFAAGVALAVSTPAQGQGGVQVQGIADVEGWSTDSGSSLLTRNHGHAGMVARVQMWSAVEPWRGIFLFAHGQVEGGNARAFGDPGSEVSLDQAGIRVARDTRFVVNAGKMFHPVGAFAPRIFSTRNPLIGVPDSYSPVYPVGAMVSGEVGRMDYRVAAVSLPLTHRDYVPAADAALRPVVGIGYTPVVGLRIGATATTGPYLNGDLTSSQTAGRSWQSYHQHLIAPDIEYGIGHLDVRAEYDYASYEVPNSGSIVGRAAYLEGRYTVTPRLFVAARGEVNHYPFIRSVSPTLWIARRTDFSDWETGLGFRVSESTLIKASYRGDKWTVTSTNPAFARPNGHALAIQLSQSFDVMDWVSAIR
jgi:hypothetical protein